MGKLDEHAFGFFDTEAWSWTRFRCAVFMTEDGDREVYRSGGRDSLHRRIRRFKGRVFAHCGGGYDFLFLPELQNVCMANSSILRAQCGEASLHDLHKLMPTSLAEIGKAVELEKIDGVSDHMDEVDDDTAIAQATRDTEIGVLALKLFKRWLDAVAPAERLPTTSGLTAIHILETFEPEHVEYLRKQVLDPGLLEEQSQATSGGRVELFQVGLVGQVWVYDLNSSYPASYMEGPLPVGPWKRVTREHKTKPGVYYCTDIKQDHKRLPLVSANHTWRRTGNGWMTSEEMQAVRAAGGTFKVQCGWVSSKSLPFGQAFAQALYPHKQAGLPWAKAALVALHGKLAQSCEQEIFVHENGRYVKDESLALPTWSQQPFLAAFIYARARLRMGKVAQALLDLGYRVYQLADDAIHTNCPPACFPAPIGPGMGAWKVAHMDMGGEVEGCYLAPKVYGLRGKDGTEHIVCRGVSSKTVSWKDLVNVANGIEVKLQETAGLVRFRSQIAASGNQQDPEAAEHSYTLRIHTGGKKRGKDGQLDYK